MAEQKNLPVYLFTGFLDGGKTKFIQETLEDPRFHQGERTLLLMCEDGEEEYDPSRFCGPNIFMRTLENELSALCARCGVPAEHMSLHTMPLTTGVSGVRLSLTDALGMDVISGLLGVVFAAIGAAVCGGGGIALVGAGPVGVLTGAIAGILLALIGRSGMEKAVRKMHIPVFMRSMVTRGAVMRGLERQREDIQRQIVTSLADPANGFAARLTASLGETLGEQLEQMAKHAEMSISA